jgi:hypothetical protein
LTLGAADPTNPRIDVLAVDNTGTVVVIPGTPAASPAAPSVDPTSQLALTFVTIPAGATTPTITSTTIYDESSTPPTEWTCSSTAAFNCSSTNNPYHLTHDIEVTNAIPNGNVLLTNNTTVNLATYNTLSFYIRNKAAWATSASVSICFLNGTAVVGNCIGFKNGVFGFDQSNITGYQQIVIPIANFGTGSNVVNKLRFQVAGASGVQIGFYLDWVQIQTTLSGSPGSNAPPPSVNVLGTDVNAAFIAANRTNVDAISYAAGGGTANAQTVSLTPVIVGLTTGLKVCWKPSNANASTTPTLAVNGLTAKTIIKVGGAALAASDLTTTAIACAIYDGTNFELQNPQTTTPGGVTSLTGDGTIFNNSGSTGAVTLTKANQNPNVVLAGPSAAGGTNVVQSVSAACTSCSASQSLTINSVGATHTLLVAAYSFGGTTVTSTGSETFTKVAGTSAFGNGDFYYTCSATGGNETLTLTGQSNNNTVMQIYEISGNDTSSCKDVNGSANASPATQVSVPTSGSVNQAGELVFVLFTNGGGIPGIGQTITFGPGYTKQQENTADNGSQTFALSSGIGNSNSGLSGVQTATASMPSAGFNFAGAIVTIKLNTPSSTAQPTFRALVTADLPSPLNGTPIGSSFNVTPVTVNANSTADQNLQSLVLPAGFFNTLGKSQRIWSAGVYSTPVASTATLTFKLKLCTVSGCGSGTVITLASWTTSANPGSVTTNPWNTDLTVITQTAGSSGALESHGNLVIDLGATAGLADSIFSDTNTATVGTIDLSNLLFLQQTVSFSAASASNTCVHRQMSAPNLY